MVEHVLERFLFRLASSPLGREHFVLKGGLLLAQFGAPRMPRDIDILGHCAPTPTAAAAHPSTARRRARHSRRGNPVARPARRRWSPCWPPRRQGGETGPISNRVGGRARQSRLPPCADLHEQSRTGRRVRPAGRRPSRGKASGSTAPVRGGAPPDSARGPPAPSSPMPTASWPPASTCASSAPRAVLGELLAEDGGTVSVECPGCARCPARQLRPAPRQLC